MLGDFFLASPSHAGRAEPPPDRFIALEATRAGASLAQRCQEALSRLPSGGGLAVAFPLNGQGRLRRVGTLLTLPLRMARAERALARCRVASVQRYGVAPDLTAPAVIYPLGTPAARYAEENLVSGPRNRLLALARRLLSVCLGFDPSLGGVLIMGNKP